MFDPNFLSFSSAPVHFPSQLGHSVTPGKACAGERDTMKQFPQIKHGRLAVLGGR